MERYFDKLVKYEKFFETAVRYNYIRNIIVRERKELHAVHLELVGTAKKFNVSCGSCFLGIMKDLGKLYFEFKDAVNTDPSPAALDDKKGCHRNDPEPGGEPSLIGVAVATSPAALDDTTVKPKRAPRKPKVKPDGEDIG